MISYANRYDAGKVLAREMQIYKNNIDTHILALPRGGVPVAYEIAKALSLPLDVFIVRKLGVPHHKELAMGAIASGGVIVFNNEILQQLHISESDIKNVIAEEQRELSRREQSYRGNKPFPPLENKTIILVDDGIATGASMRAAIKALKEKKPKRLILAVPVAAPETISEMKMLVDDIICPIQPKHFNAVGAWYDDFAQTTDNEVFQLLKN